MKTTIQESPVTYIMDVNLIYHCAACARADGQYYDAIAMYFMLVRSDDSLDAGEVGYLIAQCYESLGDRVSSRFWADRAVAENSTIAEYVQYRNSLKDGTDISIVSKYADTYEDKLNMSKKLRERARSRGQLVWPPDRE
jgi:tetratricopeptide (TPR) repeat protein